MEGCLLCLKNHKGNVGYIQVNSTHWLEFNILNIIEKHLWPIERVEPSSFLCTLCWKELYDFHKFFMNIKAAQTTSYEIEMEPHCLQISESNVSFNDDQVKLERLTNKSPIIDFRDDPQILMGQTLLTSTLQKCKSPEIIKDNTNPDVKLEEDVMVYTSSVRTNSFQENSHTDLHFVESAETDSIVTEINESNMFLNPKENIDQAKDKCQSPKTEHEQEDDILQEMFVQHVNQASFLHSSNYTLLLSNNQHTVKSPAKRGRPRKNFNNTLLSREVVANSSQTENNNSYNSIQQEDVYEGDISLKKKKRGRPKNSRNKNWLTLEQKKKMWANSMISRPARKRKLPRKLLTYDVECTNNDVNITKKIPKELYLHLKSGKRGRPRKILINSMNSSNISFDETLATTDLTDQQHPQLCDDNIPKKSGKRGRPRKYFTKDIVRPQEFCSDMPSTSTGKRGRPRKYFTNDIKSSTEIPKEQTVQSENSIPFINNPPRVKSKLKNRKRCRPYKDLMRNYIATSVRCMKLFKSKNAARSESENSCLV